MFDFDALFEEEQRANGHSKSPGALRQGAFVALILLLAVSAALSYLDVASI
jgi:hypothetical protein